MLSTLMHRWQFAFKANGFRTKIIVSTSFLLLYAFIAPIIFEFIQQRNGYILSDYVLLHLPALNLSLPIFTLLYFLIASSILVFIFHPKSFLLTLVAYVILTTLRFSTILLVPLDPPLNIVELHDPFVQFFFYQQTVTKDLFFSGHTSILVLFALTIPYKHVRPLLLIGAGIIGFMLLIQHAHYTIDILFAPLFAWLSVTLAKMKGGRNKPNTNDL